MSRIASVASGGFTSGASSVTLNFSEPPQSGDLLLFVMMAATNVWVGNESLTYHVVRDSSAFRRLFAWHKIAEAGDSASWTFSRDGSGGVQMVGYIIRSPVADAPFSVTSHETGAATTPWPAAPENVDVGSRDVLIAAMSHAGSSNSFPVAPPFQLSRQGYRGIAYHLDSGHSFGDDVNAYFDLGVYAADVGSALFVIPEGASGPFISSVTPSTLTPSSTPTISGSGFGSPPAAVVLSPSNSRVDVAAVTQTIAGGATATSIPLTGVTLPAGVSTGATLYYFVQAAGGEWSAGYPVALSSRPTLSVAEVFDATMDGFSFRFTTDAGNGPVIWAAFETIAQRNAASIEGIQAEIATPSISLARGTFTVTTAGIQTVTAVTGLGAAQTRYVRVYHDGDVTA